MKNYQTIIAGLFMLLSSCTVIPSYFGDTLPPTTSIDVYYSEHDVQSHIK